MTFQELYQGIATWVGLARTSSSLLAERKAWVNEAYHDVVNGFDWPTKYGADVIPTTAPVEDSTLQVGSVGDTTVTAAAAVWDAGWTNRKIRIGDRIYDIPSFASQTVANLADPLALAHAAGTTYTVYQDEYSCPSDCGTVLTMFTGDRWHAPLEYVAIDVMMYWKSVDNISGNDVSAWAYAGTDSSGYRKVMIHRVPSGIQNIRMRYIRRVTELSGDADIPTLLPESAHRLIALRAKKFAFTYDRERGQADATEAEYQTELARAVVREGAVSSRIRLEPGIFAHGSEDWVERARYDGNF
jgi:hypothetical protein